MTFEEIPRVLKKRIQLGQTKCPKCGHEFMAVRIYEIAIKYTVKASIQTTKSHPRDTTTVWVTADPYEAMPYEKRPKFHPKNRKELISTIKALMNKYDPIQTYIFGLGADTYNVHSPDEVDEAVDKALEYMKKHDYQPKFGQRKEMNK